MFFKIPVDPLKWSLNVSFVNSAWCCELEAEDLS